jgi:hypothetical protein
VTDDIERTFGMLTERTFRMLTHSKINFVSLQIKIAYSESVGGRWNIDA